MRSSDVEAFHVGGCDCVYTSNTSGDVEMHWSYTQYLSKKEKNATLKPYPSSTETDSGNRTQHSVFTSHLGDCYPPKFETHLCRIKIMCLLPSGLLSDIT